MIISGTRLAMLGYSRVVDEPDEELVTWALDQLYRAAGAIARSDDRYSTLFSRHPLTLPGTAHPEPIGRNAIGSD